MSTRLIQLTGPQDRRLAVVEEPKLRLLTGANSIYELAQQCLQEGVRIAHAIAGRRSEELLDYEAIYSGQADWQILPAADRPDAPANCHVTGTGLTHLASVQNRDAMHAAAQAVTDTTRMYQSGVEGGKPAPGTAGVAPEWFYKGTGAVLRGHNQPLEVPKFAEDGGEEPEIAGVYIIDAEGNPRRIGFTIGNEFSDHVLEKKNYLYLAASKLRNCAIGPELCVDTAFDVIPGKVSVERNAKELWSQDVRSGEGAMCHSLANIEHHHFKFDAHRHPGDLHIHFFGAGGFSFGAGLSLETGDVMQVAFEGFGRPLRNPLLRLPVSAKPCVVTPV